MAPVTLEKIQPQETRRDRRPSRLYSPHSWTAPVPFGAWTAYWVLLDGRRVGVVSRHTEEAYRKAGRLRVPTGVHTFWKADAAQGGRAPQEYNHYYSRGDAIRALVRAQA